MLHIQWPLYTHIQILFTKAEHYFQQANASLAESLLEIQWNPMEFNGIQWNPVVAKKFVCRPRADPVHSANLSNPHRPRNRKQTFSLRILKKQQDDVRAKERTRARARLFQAMKEVP